MFLCQDLLSQFERTDYISKQNHNISGKKSAPKNYQIRIGCLKSTNKKFWGYLYQIFIWGKLKKATKRDAIACTMYMSLKLHAVLSTIISRKNQVFQFTILICLINFYRILSLIIHVKIYFYYILIFILTFYLILQTLGMVYLKLSSGMTIVTNKGFVWIIKNMQKLLQ